MATPQETIRSKVADALSSNSIQLYNGTRGVPFTFHFAQATDAIADKLFQFWRTNQRGPTLIFNDGVPPSWKPSLMRDETALNALVDFYTATDTYINGQGESAQTETTTVAAAIFNCKLLAKDGASFDYTQFLYDYSGTREENVHIELTGAYNGRIFGSQIPPIPLSKFSAAAFQTWGLLMLAAQHPHTVYPTDEGFLITIEGVSILERTCAYYAAIASSEFGHSAIGADEYVRENLRKTIGDGPVLQGIPYPIYEYLYKLFKAGQNDNGLKLIAKIIITFVGFYFGAAAMSGLVGGAFTIPNLAGTVSMASKFGIDTGNLGPGLKVVGALTGNMDILDTVVNSAATAEAIMPVGDAWGFDSIGDSFAVADAWSAPSFDISKLGTGYDSLALGDDPWGFGELGESFGVGGFDNWGDTWGFDQIFEADFPGDAEWTTAMNTAQESFRASEIQAQNAGPVSATQFAAVAQASPSVASAAAAAMRNSGASGTAATATPAQIAAAQRTAIQQQQLAQSPQESSIWANATKLLGMYGQYQVQSMQAQAKLPQSLQYPAAAGQMVRQPDGSMTLRRPDGSLITVRPDGSIVNTGAGNSLPAFLAQNKTLLIVGGVGLVCVALIVATSRRN